MAKMKKRRALNLQTGKEHHNFPGVGGEHSLYRGVSHSMGTGGLENANLVKSLQ